MGVRTHCTFMLLVAARGGLPKGPLPLALPISPVFLSCRLGHVTGAMAECGHRRGGGVVSHIAGFFCGEWPGLVGQNLCSWYRGLASLCTWLGYRCGIITSPIMCEPKTSLEALATGLRFAKSVVFRRSNRQDIGTKAASKARHCSSLRRCSAQCVVEGDIGRDMPPSWLATRPALSSCDHLAIWGWSFSMPPTSVGVRGLWRLSRQASVWGTLPREARLPAKAV